MAVLIVAISAKGRLSLRNTALGDFIATGTNTEGDTWEVPIDAQTDARLTTALAERPALAARFVAIVARVRQAGQAAPARGG